MFEQHFQTETTIPATPAEVFTFFSDARNLARITPPTLDFHIITQLPLAMREGALIDYRLRLHGFPMRWRTLISRWNPPFDFIDEQLKGPYRTWIHHHTFAELPNGQTLMKDSVRYSLPFPPFGLVALPFVRREVEGIFAYRQKVIREIYTA